MLKGEPIWIVDAHGYGKRFIVRADDKLSAFLQLEREALIVSLTTRVPSHFKSDTLTVSHLLTKHPLAQSEET